MKRLVILLILIFSLPVCGAIKFVDSAASGGNDGTSWADAWTALSSANGVAAGDIVLVAEGTTYSAQDGASNSVLDASANGDMTAGVIYQGDDKSGGAGIGNPGYFTIDAANGGLNYCVKAKANNVFRYVNFYGAGTTAVYGAALHNITLDHCNIYSSGNGVATSGQSLQVKSCYIHNNTGTAISGGYYTSVIDCNLANNDTAVITCTTGVIVNNIIRMPDNVTAISFSNMDRLCAVINNTIDGENTGVGIDFTDATGTMNPIVINNIIYDLTMGIQAATDIGNIDYIMSNNLFNSNTDNYDAEVGTVGLNAVTEAPAFTTEGSDYSLTSSSPALATGIGATVNIGADQDDASSGGGGHVIGGGVVK